MVAIPTYDEFITRFPNFESSNEDTVKAIIAEAAAYIDSTWRVEDQKAAIQYLVAHMLTVEQEQIEGGAIASESFGPISVTYARNTKDDVLASTIYGQRFLALTRLNFAGPRFIRAGI